MISRVLSYANATVGRIDPVKNTTGILELYRYQVSATTLGGLSLPEDFVPRMSTPFGDDGRVVMM